MKKKLQALLKIAFTSIAFGISFYAVAQPGSPDISFGTNGKAITPIGSGTYDVAQAIAVQTDGKIVVAGGTAFNSFALARYTVSGALDNSFDGD